MCMSYLAVAFRCDEFVFGFSMVWSQNVNGLDLYTNGTFFYADGYECGIPCVGDGISVWVLNGV